MKNVFVKLLCSFVVLNTICVVQIHAEEQTEQDSNDTVETVEDEKDVQSTPTPEATDTPDNNDSNNLLEDSTDSTVTPEVTPEETPEVTETPEASIENSETEKLNEEPSEDDEKTDNNEESVAPNFSSETELMYVAHVQDYGWMNPVSGKHIAGTTGQSKRLEALKVVLPENLTTLGDIRIETHIQDIGWVEEVGNKDVAGTTGKSKSIEALKITLTGELSNQYDVIYRAHVQNIGWQRWQRNGSVAGTTGQSKRIEAVQVYLQLKSEKVPINEVDTTIFYKSHVQDIGWMSEVASSNISGTTGKSKRVEAIQVSLPEDMAMYGNVSVQAHVQDIGWLSPVSSGQTAGTTGQSKRLEGLKISLTGDLANYYDIYYRVHVGNIGWLGWTKNGNLAGSVGCNRRIEAFQIVVYAKNDSNAPKCSESTTTSVEYTMYTPTYYSQRDSRWAYSPTYGGYNLSSTGCVPTAIAMAVDGILHNGVTPVTMANYLYYNTSEFGTIKHGGSCLAVKLGAEHWGLKTEPITNGQVLADQLSKGRIVIMAVGPGDFTSRGYTHAIVMFQNSAGNTYVYDPWNAHNGWYNIASIWSQQSRNSYDLRGGHVGYAIYA